MKNIKKFNEFTLVESFVLKADQIPHIGDVVDKIDYKEGDRFAFIDFAGVKNIPVQIVADEDIPTNITTNESRKNRIKK